jgi:hypothetical protein
MHPVLRDSSKLLAAYIVKNESQNHVMSFLFSQSFMFIKTDSFIFSV